MRGPGRPPRGRAANGPHLVVYDGAFEVVTASEGVDRFFGAWPEFRGAESTVPPAVTAYVREQAERMRRDPARESSSLFLPDLAVHVFELGETNVAASFARFSVRDPVGVATRTFGLTRREAQVLELLLRGLRAQQIAQGLGLSELTIADYLKRLRRKTGARTQSGMIAALLGWTQPRSRAVDAEHSR